MLKVVADTPEFDQGETAENAIPLPNASKISVKAALSMSIHAVSDEGNYPEKPWQLCV